MFQQIIIFALCVTTVFSYYLEEEAQPVYDQYGREFYLTPVINKDQLHRQRRQTTVRTGSDGSHFENKQVLFNDKDHKIDLTSYTSSNPQNELTVGGKLDYLHKNTDSTFSLQAQNTEHQGRDLKAAGQYNFFRTNDGRGTIGLSGEYGRHYSGPWGTQQPNYGLFIRGNYNFP